eukprot:801650_1
MALAVGWILAAFQLCLMYVQLIYMQIQSHHYQYNQMNATNHATSLHHKGHESEEYKRWSTTQLIFICIIIALTAILASNLDDESSSSNDIPSSFGHEMYSYFEFTQEGNRDLNWGSYGGYPISIRQQIDDLHSHILNDMLLYQMLERPTLQRETLQLLAEYLGIENWEDLVFVDNASHGINAIIRSLQEFLYNNNCYEIYNDSTLYNKTCKILQFNTAYPMITETLWYINNNLGS